MRDVRDSGIAWVGTIPNEWNIKRGKFTLSLLNRPIEEGDEVITCFSDGEVTLRKNRREEGYTVSLKEIGYQGIEPGDLVVHGMDGFAGSIGISDSRGKSSPVLVVCDSEENKKYIMYYLRSMAYNDVFSALATGIRVRSCDLRWNKLAELPYILPNIDEQKRIVSAIDKNISQIEELKANVQKQIEKLKAYKQSVITEAVTKGLDLSVPMKDSGVEWMGDIPAHWVISRIKNVATILRGASPRPIDDYIVTSGAGENWIKIGDTIKGYKYITQTAQQVSHEGADKSRRVHRGDLILTNSMSFGEPYILAIDGCIHDGWLALTSLQGISEDYMYYFLQSAFCYLQFKHQVAGGIVQNLNSEKVATCIIFCPQEEEQSTIVEYLDKKCAHIDRLIAIKQSKIEKLEQYKRSLIYEYVTGKKEVS